MNLDPEAMPLHDDATFTIRPASLLGSDDVTSTAERPARRRSTRRGSCRSPGPRECRPRRQLNTMDDPAGEGLAMLVDTLGNGVNGNGENVDKTITGLAPNMKGSRRSPRPEEPQRAVGLLVEDAEPIVGALADRTARRSISWSLLRLVLGVTADTKTTLSGHSRSSRAREGRPQDVGRPVGHRGRSRSHARGAGAVHRRPPGDLRGARRFRRCTRPGSSSSRPVLDRADELLIEARRPADDLRIAGPEVAATLAGAKPLSRPDVNRGRSTLHQELGVERQRIRRGLALLANRDHCASRLVDLPVADAHRRIAARPAYWGCSCECEARGRGEADAPVEVPRPSTAWSSRDRLDGQGPGRRPPSAKKKRRRKHTV